MPRIVPRPGASDCLAGLAPSFARVASRTAAPDIQQALALRVEVEKAEDLAARRWVRRAVAADEFVVRHAAVGQCHGSPRLESCPRAPRQARSEHQRVQQVAFKPQMTRHRAVVERARQGRDEVDVTGGSAFQKAAARNFYYHLDLWRLRCPVAGRVSTIVRVVHSPSLPQSWFWSVRSPAKPRRTSSTVPIPANATGCPNSPCASENKR